MQQGTNQLKFFVRKWTGYQICIGASKEGEDYTHCIPLRDTGEFGGYSNKRLTRRVVKTATQAAESLGFPDPFWRDKEGRITMAKVKNFTKDELKKSHTGKYQYDRAMVSADLARVIEANNASQTTLITRRISMGEASDGSGKMAQHVYQEWRLDDQDLVPHGAK